MTEVCSTTWQHMTNLLFIGIGGFLGAIARYSLTIGITNRIGGHFPVGTLAVNFSGSLLLALFSVWAGRQLGLPEHLRLMIGTGFFGAYTTFSTFANESIALMQAGHWTAALGNIIGTNLLCLLGVLVGLALATRWFTS
ncbi:MAG TPA: fluoride efflux transporter CrcB [Spirillospora sp.]|nr:fluoride efflux transporter CrcB [Spirillospora sp.]